MTTTALEVHEGISELLTLFKQLQTQVAELRNDRAAATGLFQPKSLTEAWEIAKVIAESDFAPKDYRGKPGNCVIAMQYGADLNIPVLQAIQNISVVNGRPTIWGHLYWALVTNHRDFLDAEELITNHGAKITLTRRGRKPVVREFTEAMAKTAGLLGKDSPWRTYPESMYMWRARHNAGDALFPEATRGIIPREIADDFPGVTIEAGPYTTTPGASSVVDEVITQDEARAFGKAWKDAGWTIDQAKAYLKEKLSVESSLKLKKSQYQQAMRWATKAEPATTVIVENGNGNGQSRDKEICFELFKILGYDDVKQAQAIQEHGADWSKLVVALNKELPTE